MRFEMTATQNKFFVIILLLEDFVFTFQLWACILLDGIENYSLLHLMYSAEMLH